jgi:hypothetical protein
MRLERHDEKGGTAPPTVILNEVKNLGASALLIRAAHPTPLLQQHHGMLAIA